MSQQPIIHIGGLPQSITQEQLDQRFRKYGSIKQVVVKTKNGYAFAFVTYLELDDAKYAVRRMNNREFAGSNIVCSMAKPRHGQHQKDYKKMQGRDRDQQRGKHGQGYKERREGQDRQRQEQRYQKERKQGQETQKDRKRHEQQDRYRHEYKDRYNKGQKDRQKKQQKDRYRHEQRQRPDSDRQRHKRTPGEHPRDISGRKCFNCGQEGHQAKNCTSPRQNHHNRARPRHSNRYNQTNRVQDQMQHDRKHRKNYQRSPSSSRSPLRKRSVSKSDGINQTQAQHRHKKSVSRSVSGSRASSCQKRKPRRKASSSHSRSRSRSAQRKQVRDSYGNNKQQKVNHQSQAGQNKQTVKKQTEKGLSPRWLRPRMRTPSFDSRSE